MELKFIDKKSVARMQLYTLPDITTGYGESVPYNKRRAAYDKQTQKYYLPTETYGIKNLEQILSIDDADDHSFFMEEGNRWYFEMQWIVKNNLITEKASEKLRSFFIKLQDHYKSQIGI